MSWDIWLEDMETKEQIKDLGNYTHNCNQMLRLANFSFNDIHGSCCAVAAIRLEMVLTFLILNQEECESMNPSNGWGDYESLLKYTRNIYNACKKESSRVMSTSNLIVKVSG